jgi:hypothetical protein
MHGTSKLRKSEYEQVPRAENVRKLKFDPARFQAMPPFYANALEACHSMNTIVNTIIKSVADLRRTPIRNSTFTTPHISGQTLVSDEAWTTLNVSYVGDLMESGHWKHIEDFNPNRCTIPTICRLATNLKTAEAFFRPSLSKSTTADQFPIITISFLCHQTT